MDSRPKGLRGGVPASEWPREQPKFGEWQDIATAPRDGTWVLAHGEGPGFVACSVIARWAVNYEQDDDVSLNWRNVYGSNAYPCKLTHWMPLPAPPGE